MSADNKSPLKPAGRITSGALVIVVALLFGLGMGAAGFLAGRAMVIEQHSPTAVASMPVAAELAGQVESIPDEQVDNSPVVVAVTVEPTLAPSPLSATPIPTSPPTVTPEPTPEPTQPDTSNTNVIEPPAGSPLEGVEFTTFYEVWDLIAGEFDGSVPPANEMLESIITGSLETLDDNYTRYVSPDVAERMRQDEDGAV